MTVKYRVSCFDSELIVKQMEEECKSKFQLGIQHGKNPLGFGNKIAVFDNEEEAVQSANQFCHFYTKAKESGYQFKSIHFVKKDKPEILIADVLHRAWTDEEIEALLGRTTMQ
ncbi:hypothetical protein [Paenibacillus sp. HB172176]|uniref:hypothetical protein n=1 Tax=Paenibacillus sp. HB172176 TaxID=2493690 RepID=UPI00143A4411|nr:hypothetical protein [Paenibacillus sp. HB172176]